MSMGVRSHFGSRREACVVLSCRMSWHSAQDAAAALLQRRAGADLQAHLLEMYATRQISAKDFCIACYFAGVAKTQGANFEAYGLAPGQSSDGAYQRHLDRILPPVEPLYLIDVPGMVRGRGERCSRSMHTNPFHESLAKEVRMDPSILDKAQELEWPPCYHEQPLVQLARNNGERLPLPLVLYLDGVRYTALQAGRSDSILGIWAFNAVTNKRHLLISLRTND